MDVIMKQTYLFFFFYIKESFPILHYKVVSKVMDIKKKLIVVYVPL